jgi:hypothetical protein
MNFKAFTLALAFALALDPAAPVAHADALRNGQCYLSVDGKVVLDGACKYSIAKDGSLGFQNNAKGDIFGMLDMNGDGTANGVWNQGAGSHAHTPLGSNAMTRKGGCWSNDAAKLCVWAPGARPASF